MFNAVSSKRRFIILTFYHVYILQILKYFDFFFTTVFALEITLKVSYNSLVFLVDL